MVRLTAADGRAWTWREKAGEVVLKVAVAVVGAFFVLVIALAVPADVTVMRVVLGYTVFATALTAASALAMVVTRRLPARTRGMVDGQVVAGVRSWPWNRRYDIALDAGLVVVLVVVAVLGLREGGWLVPSLLLLLVASWFAARLVVVAAGRRRTEALWLGDDDLVHDSIVGRTRVPRDHVVDVRASPLFCMVEFEGAADRRMAPRPWRRRGRLEAGLLMVDLRLVGSTPSELAGWLRDELGLDRATSSTTDVRAARRGSRWWRGGRRPAPPPTCATRQTPPSVSGWPPRRSPS